MTNQEREFCRESIIYKGLCLYRDKLIKMAHEGNEALSYSEIMDLLKPVLDLIDEYKSKVS